MDKNQTFQQTKTGAPVNTKSLLAFLFNQMEKLDRGEITNETASAQAKLASQACNLLNYELKRSVIQMQLQSIGTSVTPALREIESKPFCNNLLPIEGEDKRQELEPCYAGIEGAF